MPQSMLRAFDEPARVSGEPPLEQPGDASQWAHFKAQNLVVEPSRVRFEPRTEGRIHEKTGAREPTVPGTCAQSI